MDTTKFVLDRKMLDEMKIFTSTVKDTKSFMVKTSENGVYIYTDDNGITCSIAFPIEVIGVKDREFIINKATISKLFGVTDRTVTFTIGDDKSLVIDIDGTKINSALEFDDVEIIDTSTLKGKQTIITKNRMMEIIALLSVPNNKFSSALRVLNFGGKSKYGNTSQIVVTDTPEFAKMKLSVRQDFIKYITALTKVDSQNVVFEVVDGFLVVSASHIKFVTDTLNIEIKDDEEVDTYTNVGNFKLSDISESIILLQKLMIPLEGVEQPTVDISINVDKMLMRFTVTDLSGRNSTDVITLESVDGEAELSTLNVIPLISTLSKIVSDVVDIKSKDNSFVFQFGEEHITKIYMLKSI